MECRVGEVVTFSRLSVAPGEEGTRSPVVWGGAGVECRVRGARHLQSTVCSPRRGGHQVARGVGLWYPGPRLPPVLPGSSGG